MKKILISNDDGIHAEGINILAKHIGEIADITLVAPDRNRSGASNSLSLDNPIRVQQLDANRYSVEGTPTDCVHLALTGLLDEKHGMVIAGINAGANLGDDVLYSGTVAAASEGRFLGPPSIAVSLASENNFFENYDTAGIVAQMLIKQLSVDRLPRSTILNVNVPDVPFCDLRGIEVTRLGTRHGAEPTIKQTDPRGKTIYWVGPPGEAQDDGPGTDFHAIKSHKVSITPIQLDFTHYEAFEQLSSWIGGLKIGQESL